MKRLNGYDKAERIDKARRLPVGGYVLKILNVEYKSESWGDVIILSFDINEGEEKDFFAKNYRAQTGEDKKWKGTYRISVPKEDGSDKDEYAMRRFKTIMEDFEESNNGYKWNWEEQTLKNKLIGALFNDKEWEFNGRTGMFTNCYSLTTVDKIRSNNFEVPAPTLLNKTPATAPSGDLFNDGFQNIPDGIDEQLPF